MPQRAAGWRTEPPVSVPSAHQPSPAATAAADPPEDEHTTDLRLLMTLAVAVALGVHAVRLGTDLERVLDGIEGMASSFLGSSMWPGPASSNVGMFPLLLLWLAAVAMILLAVCSVLWVVWGVLALNYGPAARQAVRWLAAVTLILAVLTVAPGWAFGMTDNGSVRGTHQFGMLARAPEIVHALFLALLLSRPGVRRLFARNSQTDDPD